MRDESFFDLQFDTKATFDMHLSSKYKKVTSIDEGGELEKNGYECQICQGMFSQSSSLKTHIASVHEGKKPFKCSSCAYNCSTKKDLTMHIESVHEGKKPFKCSSCDYKCSTKQSLTKHIKSVHEANDLFYSL